MFIFHLLQWWAVVLHQRAANCNWTDKLRHRMWVDDAVCQLENNFLPALDFKNNRRRVVLPEVNTEGNKVSATRLVENYWKRISNFPLSLFYFWKWKRQQQIFHSNRLFNQIFLQTGWQIGITRFHTVEALFFCALPFKSPSTRHVSIHLGPSFDWVIYSEKIALKLKRMNIEYWKQFLYKLVEWNEFFGISFTRKP